MEKDSPFSFTGRRCIVALMCIFVTTLVYAQQQKISVSIKELPLKEAINQIAEKASMNVAYSKELKFPTQINIFSHGKPVFRTFEDI